MSAKTKPQPVHGDGFQWEPDLLSGVASWTLVNPDGHWVAHVCRTSDRTWAAVWDDGELISAGHEKSGRAIRAVDDVARPCAHVDTHPSHGIVPCDNDREPGTMYCTPHQPAGEVNR